MRRVNICGCGEESIVLVLTDFSHPFRKSTLKIVVTLLLVVVVLSGWGRLNLFSLFVVSWTIVVIHHDGWVVIGRHSHRDDGRGVGMRVFEAGRGTHVVRHPRWSTRVLIIVLVIVVVLRGRLLLVEVILLGWSLMVEFRSAVLVVPKVGHGLRLWVWLLEERVHVLRG